MKAMIFAAGLGTRLKPITDTLPKALVPVGGRPLIDHVCRRLADSGIGQAVVNVHHFADKVEEWVRTQDIMTLEAKGIEVDINDVLKNLQERDYIDSHRETSPLTQAADAIVLDNSHMSMDDQMEWLRKIISDRFGC